MESCLSDSELARLVCRALHWSGEQLPSDSYQGKAKMAGFLFYQPPPKQWEGQYHVNW